MTIARKPSAANLLKRQIERTTPRQPTPARRPAPHPADFAIELHRRNAEALARLDAKRKAEEEAARNASRSAPEALHAAITRGSSNPLPLNGAAVLRAALAGGNGSINGQR